MQHAQRGVDNGALNLAIAASNALNLPVLAAFALTADYPGAHRRHYRFLLEGLVDCAHDLDRRGVRFVVRLGHPDAVIPAVAEECGATMVVGDENPVRIGQHWCERVAERLRVPFYLVDADVVVPSSHFPAEEFAARTLRPKIQRLLPEYLRPIANPHSRVGWDTPPPVGEVIDRTRLMERLKVGGIPEVPDYSGGTREAMRRLRHFIRDRLPRYATERNEPTPYFTSELSAHLHFGHISPLTIALAVSGSDAPREDADAYLEELIVRRELSINFVARNPAPRTTAWPAAPSGRVAPWPSMPTTHGQSSTRRSNSSAPRRTTPSGTPRNSRWRSPAGCTITSGCTGPRRSSSGAPTPKPRSTSRWT
jgi:deoxyribodipyrimidine photo-lyase